MPNVQTANRAPGSESVQGQKAQTQNQRQKNHKNRPKYSDTLNQELQIQHQGHRAWCAARGAKSTKLPEPKKHPEKSVNMYKTDQVLDVSKRS